MFTTIRAIWARYRAAALRVRYEAGWDWAAGELLRGKPAEDLEMDLVAGTFDEGAACAAFDEGAAAALAAWARLCVEQPL